MTKLTDLFSMELFEDMVENKFVRVQTHPEFPELSIAGYTETTQFARKWNDVTRTARGLIYNNETLEVLARPFAKTHNWDEPEAPAILNWDAPLFSWSNKFDGSLGIVYKRPDGRLAMATRGSFASEQAEMGTKLLDANPSVRSEAADMISMGYTPLYEIVGPENRIVLMYDKADIMPLGAIHIETGAYLPHASFDFTPRSFKNILDDLSRGEEGWVVWISPFKAVKIKEASYVELHRIVTGYNRKSVWRTLKDGTFEENASKLPDELYKWAEDEATKLIQARLEIVNKVEEFRDQIAKRNFATRRELAEFVTKNVPADFRGLVFSSVDGRDITEKTWLMVEPRGDA